MNRWKASAIHLLISLVLAASVASLLYFLWFPSPYFVAAGAGTLMLLLIGVDVCVGPLLTLLLVNPRKSPRMIRIDLTVIGLVQAAAFVYGIHVIAEARPVFVVAEVNRLVLVTANELSDADLARGPAPIFRHRSWTGPVQVGAKPPTGLIGAQLAMNVLQGDKDIDQLPMYYVPWSDTIDTVIENGRPAGQLKAATPAQKARLMRLAADPARARWIAVPLRRGGKDYTALLSPTRKRPVEVLAIDPWQ